MWHRKLWLIDHGAALYFHHGWGDGADRSASAFPAIKDHILLKFAGALDEADAAMSARITPALIQEIVALVPDAWLASDKAVRDAGAGARGVRPTSVAAPAAPRAFLEEAKRARAMLV